MEKLIMIAERGAVAVVIPENEDQEAQAKTTMHDLMIACLGAAQKLYAATDGRYGGASFLRALRTNLDKRIKENKIKVSFATGMERDLLEMMGTVQQMPDTLGDGEMASILVKQMQMLTDKDKEKARQILRAAIDKI